MKVGRPSKFTNEDLAIAYELHCDGSSWKAIARAIGDGIKDAVYRVMRNGLY